MPVQLPPLIQTWLNDAMPWVQAQQRKAEVFFGPLWAEFGPQIIAWWDKAKKGLPKNRVPSIAGVRPLGGQFRHILIVGLNRAELLIQNEENPVFNENWQELIDDTMRRHLALVFFAPRGLDSKPVDPIGFLMGEEEGVITTQMPSVLQGMALLDFCRMSPAEPNTVNVLAAADCLFHWDNKDTYVSPTNPTTWTRDLEAIIKTYPRTTRTHVYTQWETNLLNPTERLVLHKVRALPLASSTWLNEPTVQERYSLHALLAGIGVAVLIWLGLWWQGNTVTQLTEELNMVQQQIPRGGQFTDLERAVAEQEKHFARRPLFYLAVKDIQRAITLSDLQVEQIELKIPDTNQVPQSFVLTLTMPPEAYSGWLQQEPIARAFLMNTAMVHAVRKPPSSAGFKLEGLIMLNPWLREYQRLLPQLPANFGMGQAVSGTVVDQAGPQEPLPEEPSL